ncbi:alpha/beta-hydrolase [Gloeophyllum trabeum ATCC 11539]|uniref:Alpha/beta-hydrolase n=1 Tax=Gloeophyllum trabeum (strain ATCC 11539 / FP-39264 / Madison 617) TaxID=670483 RepID=S7PXV8_GLOTA|nr:alpha/beta-hydrolase [Gloeophyllum trabeum ATCC 11539]EPQ52177.1 alpha/beta-hydrolase [Gloeophyllum trabeum ATCC 11539]
MGCLYDDTPVYDFQEDMPWAREPWKAIYVVQRLFTTLLLVPLWALYYLIMPRSYRPRPSWSIRMIICVKFMKRVHKVTEVAGVTWGTRNPESEETGKLKETRFEWVEPLPLELQTGIVRDEKVKCKRVGCFVWPKEPTPLSTKSRRSASSSEKYKSNGKGPRIKVEVAPYESPDPNRSGVDLRSIISTTSAATTVTSTPPPVVGIFLHGGGFCHMSAHESSGTSRIPRRLIQDKVFTEIYAVEYRLLQYAPVPGAIQDAAAVYAHVVMNVLGAAKDIDGIYRYPGTATQLSPNSSPNLSIPSSAPAHAEFRRPRVVLIGDSAGGNLILGLARWIRDEGILPMPDGMLLLSPSCDPSHAFPIAPSSYIPRPHSCTDYLVDTPEPRALLQKTFLGHHPIETIHSPYISPASPRVLRAYGHSVEWDGEGGQYGPLQLQAMEAAEGNIGMMTSVPLPTHAGNTTLSETGQSDCQYHVNEANSLASGAVSGSSGRSGITSVTSGVGVQRDGRAPSGHLSLVMEAPEEPLAAGAQGIPGPPLAEDITQLYLNPAPVNPAHRTSLFRDFPPCFVMMGDAERLEREVGLLVRAMQHDGVDVKLHIVKDAVHDCLILKWWDEKERQKVWNGIAEWVQRCVIMRSC